MTATDSRDTTEQARHREQFARFLRLGAHLSDIVSCWAGFPLQGEQTAQATIAKVDEADALLLDVPTSTAVTRRDVHLVSPMRGPVFLAAAVTEFVHEPRLGLDLAARRRLHHGADPVDQLVDNLRRTVCWIIRPDEVQHPNDVALQAKTILVAAGCPVAVVVETVYWRLITHRTPTVLAGHTQPVSMLTLAPR